MTDGLQFPRLIYRGASDESAETLIVEDADALDVALKAGYRLQRNPPKVAEPVDPPKGKK